MSSDVLESPVEPSQSDAEAPSLHASLDPPALAANSSASGDELSVSLSQVRPDPLLGEYNSASEDNANALTQETEPGMHDSAASVVAATEEEPLRSDALNSLAAIDLGDASSAPAPGVSVSSFDAFGALDLTNSPPATKPPVATTTGDDEDDDKDEDEPPPRGASLALMLTASYASAVTLGLIWVLWSGRRLPESPDLDLNPPADTRPDPGVRADRSRVIVAPGPIPKDHVIELGKMLRVGQVEVTALGVGSGPVTLVRDFGSVEKKEGGKDALKLRVRLKNVSTDTVLAPLDEAFIRDRPRDDPDSFVETSQGGPTISQFPLAVASEWSIAGQEIRDLKPGETLETLVVSAPDALAHKAPSMTWRLRLRTDINQTEVIGVHFRDADIKAEP